MIAKDHFGAELQVGDDVVVPLYAETYSVEQFTPVLKDGVVFSIRDNIVIVTFWQSNCYVDYKPQDVIKIHKEDSDD